MGQSPDKRDQRMDSLTKSKDTRPVVGILKNSPSPIKRAEGEVESIQNYNVVRNLDQIDYADKIRETSPFKGGLQDSTFVRDDQSMKRDELSFTRNLHTFTDNISGAGGIHDPS